MASGRRARSGIELIGRSRWVSHLLAKQLRDRVQEIGPDADGNRRDIGRRPNLCRHCGAYRAKDQRSPGQRQSLIYSPAANSPNTFHDTTTGDNMVPCTAGSTDCPASGMIGYSAAAGYDLATGWGSVDAAAMVAAWNGPTNPDFEVMAQSASLAVTRGAPGYRHAYGNRPGRVSQTISLTCVVSSTLTGTTCSLSPDSVAPGGTATLTVTASPLAGVLTIHPLFRPGGWMAIFVFAAGLLLTRAKPARGRKCGRGQQC